MKDLWQRVRRPFGSMVGWAFAAVFPLLLAVTAGAIARFNGCTLNEGNVHPCVVCGTDIGETLYSMGMMAWFSLITLPVGGAAAAAYAVACVVEVVLWALGRKGR
jgi:hypothetical protein